MSTFLVSPSSDTPWSLDPEAFALRLKARWPEIEVRELEDSLNALSFRVPVDGDYPPLGHLMSDGQAVTLEGGLAESAEVAAWMREIVEPEQELLFYDEGYSFDVPLRPGITRDEIVAAVLAA
ncbi:hypothetical protein DVA67_003155 [Solirubrobacter sp. CPCC 204708]|uniref:Uncharacterized protein n=1 Tax=Solirubrobacter deserti TaxID=2282478 RepID=A0ABT4RP48_9ACTN|nr:hypothetical protein [Solirubrobacter deserti]MBE2314956.1 hypothetical protein [Solirubrobacter deserti]MDA0140188.1 hypothetical protein [Solirubrobacter deserti]